MKIVAVFFLLIILSLQLFFSVRRESQTWDEANHILPDIARGLMAISG